MGCTCNNYPDLKPDRKSVLKRINETKILKKVLVQLDKHPDGENILFHCEDCGQFWQSSRAWNWGNEEYLFKVPETQVEVWKDEPYVQPDELIVFIGAMQNFMSNFRPVETTSKCKVEGCNNNAIELSVFCANHHVESLQSVGNLPKKPQGKLFPPYDGSK